MFLHNTAQDETEAYILGFLYADGFLTNKVKDKYYQLGCNLAEKDAQHLRKIARFFDREVKLSNSKVKGISYGTAEFGLGDVRLIERLINLGIVPNKTYENSSFVFDNIPVNLKHHFLRGYFDGDGTVCTRKDNQCMVGFVSHNELLLIAIREFLKTEIELKAKVRKDKNNFRLYFGGTNIAIKFKNTLYQQASIFLERKKLIFDNIKSPYQKKYKYKGIKFNSQRNKWQAEIYLDINNQKKYLGLFDSELEALVAYNDFARKNNKREQLII